MAKNIAAGLSAFGGSVGLKPIDTTEETGTLILPAGTIARIEPKRYRTATTVDGVEVFPKLSAISENYSTNATSDERIYTVPDGAEVELTVETFASGGTMTVTIVDNYGLTVATYSTGVGSWTSDAAVQNVVMKAGYGLNHRITGGTANTRIYMGAVKIPERDQIEINAESADITIVGDIYNVTTYEVITTMNSAVVRGRVLESTQAVTGSFAVPAGKEVVIRPKEYGAPLTFDDGTTVHELMPQLYGGFSGNFTVGNTWVTAITGVQGYRLFYAWGMTGNTLVNAQMRVIRDTGFGDAILKVKDKWGNTVSGSYTTPSPSGVHFDEDMSFNMVLEENDFVQNRSVSAGHGTNVQYKYWPDPESTKDKEFRVYGGAVGGTISGDEYIVEVYS